MNMNMYGGGILSEYEGCVKGNWVSKRAKNGLRGAGLCITTARRLASNCISSSSSQQQCASDVVVPGTSRKPVASKKHLAAAFLRAFSGRFRRVRAF